MPYCSYCQQEYAGELEHCPQCRRLLLAQKPVWQPYDPDEPLVEVRTAYNEFQAHLLRGQLEQEGIAVIMQPREAGAVLGLIVDGWGEHRILVPESLAAQAEEILAAFEEPET